MGDIPENLLSLLTRDIPAELRDHEDCLKMCREVLSELATPEDIEATCFHETGHFIYTVALSIVVQFPEEQLVMHGPQVTYENDDFGWALGSVQSPYDSSKIPFTTEIVEHLARVAVAGGVYARKYGQSADKSKGVRGDIRKFNDYYRLALQTLHKDPAFLEASEYIEDAEKKVAEKRPVFEQYAKNKMIEYKQAQFLPFLAYATKTKTSGVLSEIPSS